MTDNLATVSCINCLQSGQVRIFNVHIQSKLLSVTATVIDLHQFLCFDRKRKCVCVWGGGGGGVVASVVEHWVKHSLMGPVHHEQILYHCIQHHVVIGRTVFRDRAREMFYLTTHSTHFIYGYMASDIWLMTILIMRKETCCRHIGYSFRLTARVLLYAPSHKQDSTYHGLCYISHGALAGTRNSSMGPPHEGSIRRPITP